MCVYKYIHVYIYSYECMYTNVIHSDKYLQIMLFRLQFWIQFPEATIRSASHNNKLN